MGESRDAELRPAADATAGARERRPPPLPAEDDLLLDEDLVLADLVSHVLDRGAVVAGEVVISLAGVDLVQLGLRLYVTSTETARRAGMPFLPGGGRGSDIGGRG